MAIYHLSTNPISRSSGRSAVASIAYRAGIKITDERLGKTYDYTKRHGVLWTGMATPNGAEISRDELWNLAEKTENRSNSRTAREIVINIPHELMTGDQATGKMLAYEFASQLSSKYQIAVDVAVHAPDKHGDNRNYHAHLLLTTRQLEQNKQGQITLGKKSQLEMSNSQLKQAGLLSNQDELKEIRKAWAELANEYLAEHDIDERIDHRSHADRGLNILPTVKMGWQATELERKGIRTDVGDINRAIKAYNETIKKQEIIEQQKKSATNDNHLRKAYNQRKIRQARVVPNTNTKRNREPLRASDSGFKLSSSEINQRHELLAKFHEKIQQLAEQILENELKALQEKAKPLLSTFEKLRDNEPLFFRKDQWRKDKQQALDAYNKIKEQHDAIKAKGVTTEHRQQAEEQLAKDDPSYHQRGIQAFFAIKLHELAELDNLAKQYGADKHAKSGDIYRGKIIQSDDNTSLQETTDGIVFHRIGNLTVGKSYTLSHNDKTYKIQQNYEVRIQYQNKQKDKGKSFGD